MSKKTKSQIRRARISTSSSASQVSEVRKSAEFNPDYTYVTRDLRRIGILVGSFIAILVLLFFLLPLIT
jgi:hypothetical protein